MVEDNKLSLPELVNDNFFSFKPFQSAFFSSCSLSGPGAGPFLRAPLCPSLHCLIGKKVSNRTFWDTPRSVYLSVRPSISPLIYLTFLGSWAQVHTQSMHSLYTERAHLARSGLFTLHLHSFSLFSLMKGLQKFEHGIWSRLRIRRSQEADFDASNNVGRTANF